MVESFIKIAKTGEQFNAQDALRTIYDNAVDIFHTSVCCDSAGSCFGRSAISDQGSRPGIYLNRSEGVPISRAREFYKECRCGQRRGLGAISKAISLFWGPVSKDKIIGKVLVRVWPIGKTEAY